MQFSVRGVTFALLSIAPAIFLAGCVTTASSSVTENNSRSVTANNPHPDLPGNYRKQIAEFMRTQMFASMGGIKGAEISEPNRAFSWLGTRDVVCVRFGGGGWPNFSTVRAYAFTDGQLQWGTGGIVSQFGQGVLTEAMACGATPNFKPFPEADYKPQA
jgi:hypothetical protein